MHVRLLGYEIRFKALSPQNMNDAIVWEDTDWVGYFFANSSCCCSLGGAEDTICSVYLMGDLAASVKEGTACLCGHCDAR